MAATVPATPGGDSLPGEARYFDHVAPYSTDGSLVPSPYNDYSFKWAAGGFLSTSDNLIRFANGLLRPEAAHGLHPATVSLMTTPLIQSFS